jgi:hypothetical protein
MIKSRRMTWARNTACMGRKGMVGKPEGKRPLGRPRCRREENIKFDLRQDRVV